MKPFSRMLKNVVLVGQLGFCIVIPPMLLLYLAHLARTHWGWGAWVSIAAIVIGLLAAFSSALQVVSQFKATKKESGPTSSRSFNEHL